MLAFALVSVLGRVLVRLESGVAALRVRLALHRMAGFSNGVTLRAVRRLAPHNQTLTTQPILDASTPQDNEPSFREMLLMDTTLPLCNDATWFRIHGVL